MSRRKIVKRFAFEETNRSELTFSDATKIRMDPKTNQIELKIQSYERATGKPVYSLDTDLTVTTWTTTPQAVRQWLGFGAEPRESSQPDGTSVRYKLNDGTNDRYWGGSSWDVAGATDWNDESTVAANIGSFPVTQQLQVIVRLATTDKYETPTLTEVALLMDCEIDYLDSVVHDALIPSLKASFRPVLRFGVLAPGGTKISLLDVETPYNVVDVVRAYDHDNDPDHATDILSSYSSTDETITLTTSVERGTQIRFEYETEPEVYLDWGSQDYTEVEKLPAVVIDRIQVGGNQIFGECAVNDISANPPEATALRFPFRLNLEIDIVLLAEKNRTLLKMWDHAFDYSSNVLLLPWPAVDEEIGMRLTGDKQAFNPTATLNDVHSSSFTALLTDIHLWLTPEESIPLVQTFELTVIKAETDVVSPKLIRTEIPTC